MLFANNANTTLASSIVAGDVSMVVTSATNFPSLSVGQYFYCTLADAATQTTIEIVKVTATSGTTFTITRAQDGTTASGFAAGAVVSVRLVRASLNNFPKLDEDNTFTGAITFSTPLAATNMVQSTTSTSGYLSSTDWTTFNSKAPGVTFTTNYIPYGQGTTTLNQSANLQFNGSKLGINIAPTTTVHAYGATNADQYWDAGGTVKGYIQANTTNGYLLFGTLSNHDLSFWSNSAARMRLFASGGVSIGNTTDPGATNLSVTGNLTLGTALTVPNGGTGLTTLPSGYIPFGNGTGALSSSANLQFNGTSLVVSTPASYTGIVTTTGANSGFMVNRRDTNANAYLLYSAAGSLQFYNAPAAAVRMTLDASGNLSTTGTISPQQATTAAAPAYVKGAIYFDTTLNKLRVGGATAWETITSV
jgi:hypothetical protein